LHQATEPYVLFPAFAVLVLAMIWGATLNLIHIERVGAGRAAAVSSRELAETYEAQVVRALREIDQTLKVVKYAFEWSGERGVLSELKARTLLPPDLLFVVSITDARGSIVASTRPSGMTTVVDPASFQAQRQNDSLSVDRPRPHPGSPGGQLQFSRRLNAEGGDFAGVVVVAVDADYFVSGYETSKLGQRGVLGILGSDGVFRARRTGDVVSSGDAVDYASTVAGADQDDTATSVSVNSWDGVRRYTSARPLYDFPLAVVVGLSEDEQMAAADRSSRVTLWWAFCGSALLVLVVATLGRTSWQLAQSRRRESEERLAHAKRVEYFAYHDGLTTLPNRSLFSKLLSQATGEARRYHRQLAVLFLDLDRFKHINDTLGHEAGDQLLQEVASRLKACLRDSDTVARLGGDEFVVLLPELPEENHATAVARKILSGIAKPFVLLGHEFRVTTSIGISVYPGDGLDEQTLMKHADIAMYRAKEEGKNQFQFFSENLNAQSLERLALESSLRYALEHNEFRLHYQAKRDMRSGQITGMEALLRWQHPDLGTVAPMKFIPIAEETGLIIPIGRWVLKTACLQNVAWQKQGLPRLSVAINLTARQFSDDALLPDLASILRDTGMDARLLELEITESLLMHDLVRALHTLTALKDMGVRIAIDNFGSGYVSLSALKQFPLDTIKIDRSFIRDVASGSDDKALAEAVIAMGRTLSLTVVAQGVETKAQVDFLREHACDELQGFYFNRPVPAEQFEKLLQTQSDIADSGTHATDVP
jgi:diguanylate cyclase (GGDEF)-like protein